MFMDLGYILHSLPALNAGYAGGANEDLQVLGSFTVLNQDQSTAEESNIHAANCYTALRELNYCYHPACADRPHYLPDGGQAPSGCFPFEHVYLHSPTTLDGERLIDADGEYDHQALLQMIGINLFLDSYAGTYTVKESMRTNFRQMLEHVGQPDKRKRNPRALSAFGTSAICYPKYTLAKGAAIRLGEKIIGDLLDDTVDGVVVGEEVETCMKSLKDGVFPQLVNRQGERLEQRIIDECKDESLLQADSRQLQERLKSFPGSADPMVARFAEDGAYHDYVQSQYRSVVAPACRKLVRDFYETCRVGRKCSLLAVQEALGRLRQAAEAQRKEAEQKSSRAVGLEITTLGKYFDHLRHIEHDPWLGMVGLRETACDERKRQILHRFSNLMRYRLVQLRLRFEAMALGDLLDEIGKVSGALGSEIARLQECYSPTSPKSGHFFKAKNKVSLRLKHPAKNLKFIVPNGEGSYERELEMLHARVQGNQALEAIYALPEQTEDSRERPAAMRLDHWIGERESSKVVADRMIDALVVVVLKAMDDVNVMNHAIRSWDELSSTTSFSSPYIELNEYFFGGEGRLAPPGRELRNEVFAPGSANELDAELKQRVPKLGSQKHKGWNMTPMANLDHYMIFYCEEPYFTTTYMTAFPRYQRAYQEPKVGTNQILKWTDKNHAPLGPDLDAFNRAEYLGFLMEMTRDVLTGVIGGDRGTTDSAVEDLSGAFFRIEDTDRGVSFFLDQRRTDGLVEPVRVGDVHDYERVAELKQSKTFIPFLVDRLIHTFRSLGDSPRASVDKLAERCSRLLEQLHARRSRYKDDRTWDDDKDEKEYNEKRRRIEAFLLHCKELAWGERPTPEDRQRLYDGYTWLLDWRKEDY
jgi:hypothetical protein